MELVERPERPKPAGWVIAEFTGAGELESHLHQGGRVWDDETVAAQVVEDGEIGRAHV